MTRFAGNAIADLIGRVAKGAWGAVKPSGVADAVMDFGPDLFYAANAASRAAPGWGLPLAGEELATGLGYSLLGRIAGDTVGKKAFKLNPAIAADAEKLAQLRMAGSMGLSIPLSVFGPRPVLDSMIAAQSQGQNQEQEQQQLEADAREHIMGEQLINSMLNTGGLTARTLAGPQIPGLSSLTGISSLA